MRVSTIVEVTCTWAKDQPQEFRSFRRTTVRTSDVGNAHLTPLLTRDSIRSGLLSARNGKTLWKVKQLGSGFGDDLGWKYQTSPTIEEAWAFAGEC